MAEALARNAQRFPTKPALIDERRTLTHLDFHLRTNRLANYLLKQGLSRGDRVALACGNRVEHLETIFALAKIGVIAVPFDYSWKIHEYDAMIKFFEPSVFIVEEREETKNALDLITERLKPNYVLTIGTNITKRATSYEESLSRRQCRTIRK